MLTNNEQLYNPSNDWEENDTHSVFFFFFGKEGKRKKEKEREGEKEKEGSFECQTLLFPKKDLVFSHTSFLS